MFTEGYINMHRKILNWEWYSDVNVYRVFTHLIYTANWTKQKWHGINIDRGQRVISIEHLADETNLSVQQVRTVLNKLRKTRRNNNQINKQILRYNYCKLWVLSINGRKINKQINKQETIK